MKRNMNLVREILLCVEADHELKEVSDKYGWDLVVGHIELLLDAQLVVGSVDDHALDGSVFASVHRLTWAGHEFIDNARNDTIWNKVVSKVGTTVATASFDVLAELLKGGVLAAIQKI